MTRISDIMEFLDSIAPFDLQEEYDNAGLIVGQSDMKVKGVLFSLDATPEVIAEAKERKCNVVISHHPIIFRGLKRINGEHYVEKAIISAIKNDIALIAIHTNLDNVLENGVNMKIAEKIGVVDIEPLRKKDSPHTDYETGSGVIGFLPEKMPALDFLKMVKKNMRAGCIKYTEVIKPTVRKIAVCGGSGSFLLRDAIAAGADVFVSADFKYHDYFEANGEIIIADIGHFESEQFTIELLFDLITKSFTNFAAHYTNHNTNPVKYL